MLPNSVQNASFSVFPNKNQTKKTRNTKKKVTKKEEKKPSTYADVFLSCNF
jgi:hypothetical protein